MTKQKNEICHDLDIMISVKDEEVKVLGLKMDAMAIEFTDMIKSIYSQMQNRLDVPYPSAEMGSGALLAKLERTRSIAN